jgi:hypothetical protein
MHPSPACRGLADRWGQLDREGSRQAVVAWGLCSWLNISPAYPAAGGEQQNRSGGIETWTFWFLVKESLPEPDQGYHNNGDAENPGTAFHQFFVIGHAIPRGLKGL